MVMNAIVYYQDVMLVIEIDDSSPHLLKTGTILQVVPVNGPINGGTERPPGRALVAVPEQSSKKTNKGGGILNYRPKPHTGFHDEIAKKFCEFLQKQPCGEVGYPLSRSWAEFRAANPDLEVPLLKHKLAGTNGHLTIAAVGIKKLWWAKNLKHPNRGFHLTLKRS